MKMDETVRKIPKAELHVHIEGTVTPSMAKNLAGRHNMTLPEDIFRMTGRALSGMIFWIASRGFMARRPIRSTRSRIMKMLSMTISNAARMKAVSIQR